MRSRPTSVIDGTTYSEPNHPGFDSLLQLAARLVSAHRAIILHSDHPGKELAKYADRITAIQLKDTAPPGTALDEGWAATGDGIIDWPALYPLFAATRATVLVVEHDNPTDWKACAARSIAYIRALTKD